MFISFARPSLDCARDDESKKDPQAEEFLLRKTEK